MSDLNGYAYNLTLMMRTAIYKDEWSKWEECHLYCNLHKLTKSLLDFGISINGFQITTTARNSFKKNIETQLAEGSTKYYDAHVVCPLRHSQPRPTSLKNPAPSTYVQHITTQHLEEELMHKAYMYVYLNFMFI